MSSKAGELAILDTAIKALGELSYLGPWLVSVRDEVERDLRSDWVPGMLPSEAIRRAQELERAGKLQAEELVAYARRQATDTAETARRDAERVRREAADSLRSALKRIEGWA